MAEVDLSHVALARQERDLVLLDVREADESGGSRHRRIFVGWFGA